MSDPRFFTRASPFTLQALAELSGAVLADPNQGQVKVNDVVPLDQAGETDISFFSNTKYLSLFQQTKALACVVHPKYVSKAPPSVRLLLADDPYLAYAKIIRAFYPDELLTPSIHASAIIAHDAVIGEGCNFGPGVIIKSKAEIGSGSVIDAYTVIDNGVKIGKAARVGAHVTISHALIGDHVILHPGVRIGQDGFGYATEKAVHLKIPQVGRVIIGHHVEIGANTCIDRGAGSDTVVGDGTKIDNLVQIGHNVRFGRSCIVVSQVGVAGSSVCDDFVVLGGQVGVAGHLQLGKGVQVAAGSGVGTDISPGEVVAGIPAVPIKLWHRQTKALRRLIKSPTESTEEEVND